MDTIIIKEKKDAMLIELEKYLIPFFKKGINSIYDHIKKNNKQRRFLLKEFQHALKNIGNWNTELKVSEWNRCIALNAKVEYYISHIYTFTCIILSGKNNLVCDCCDYIHKCYLNIARMLWKNPYVIYDIGICEQTRQKNSIELECIIKKSLHNTFLEIVHISPEIQSVHQIEIGNLDTDKEEGESDNEEDNGNNDAFVEHDIIESDDSDNIKSTEDSDDDYSECSENSTDSKCNKSESSIVSRIRDNNNTDDVYDTDVDDKIDTDDEIDSVISKIDLKQPIDDNVISSIISIPCRSDKIERIENNAQIASPDRSNIRIVKLVNSHDLLQKRKKIKQKFIQSQELNDSSKSSFF